MVGLQFFVLPMKKKEIDGKANIVHLLVWPFTGIVLVFVIGVELKVSSDGEQATGIKIGGAPLVVLLFVIRLGRNVRNKMVGMDRDGAFERQLISIAPGKDSLVSRDPPGFRSEIKEISFQGKFKVTTVSMRFIGKAFGAVTERYPVSKPEIFVLSHPKSKAVKCFNLSKWLE